MTMPTTHSWFGTFLAYSSVSVCSGGGGCVIGIAQRIVHLFPRIEHTILLRGYAHVVICRPAHSDDGMVFCNVHMEPASPIAVRRRVIDDIAQITAQFSRCTPHLGG